jgi:hypothetical protein
MLCDLIPEVLSGLHCVGGLDDKDLDLGPSTDVYQALKNLYPYGPGCMACRQIQGSVLGSVRVRAHCAIIARGAAVSAPVLPGSLCDSSETFVKALVSGRVVFVVVVCLGAFSEGTRCLFSLHTAAMCQCVYQSVEAAI